MPAALTLEEKKERALAKLAEAKEGNTTASPVRRRRGVFNGTEGKLKVNGEIPGYHLHIMNDTPGRISTAIDNGYEFVKPSEVGGLPDSVSDRNTDLGDKIRFLVGSDASGGPLYAYLLKIKQEWYDEDQAVLRSRNDQIEDAIRGGKLTKEGTSSEGFYSPKGGIKVNN
jgi:hypothetical protein